MSAYYFYANRSKQEWFSIDPADHDVKRYGIGKGLGSRAFCLLLLDNDPEHSVWDDHPLLGSWCGDSVYISGDDYDPDYQSIKAEWRDIADDVLDMMSISEPGAFLDAGGGHWFGLFINEGMNETIRRRLLTHFRQRRQQIPSEELDHIVDALRPRPSEATRLSGP